MASLLFSLVAAIVFFSPTASPYRQNPPAYWKLALHWPNSFCRTSGVKCSHPIPKNAFVIRTLFGVTKWDQEMPPCYGKQPPLDPSKIAEIQQTLSEYWPDLQGDNFGLWQKEWQDRAACYGLDPAKYFLEAIGLKIDIDRQIVFKGFGGYAFSGEQVFGTLYRQYVRPGNTYPYTIFGEKISSKYGLAMEVLCNDDASEVSQLLEFHMCANATTPYRFHLFPCSDQETTECMKDVRFT